MNPDSYSVQWGLAADYYRNGLPISHEHEESIFFDPHYRSGVTKCATCGTYVKQSQRVTHVDSHAGFSTWTPLVPSLPPWPEEF